MANSDMMWAFLPIGMVFLILGLTQDNMPYLSVGIVFFVLSFALSSQSDKSDSTEPAAGGNDKTDPDDLLHNNPESK